MPRSSKTGVRGLSRRDDGRFEIDLRWYEPGTGEYRRYREVLPEGAPAAAAKKRGREVVGLALAGGWKPKQRDDRCLKAALGEYVVWRKTNGRAAIKHSEAAAARLVDSLGDVCLDEVSPFAVERYKRERREGGAAPATVNRDLALLRHFYGLAATWGWVSKAHAAELRDVASLKEPPGRVRYLSADEEARLMAALERRPHLRRVVLAALLTGMRQGEILGLRREAVDLAAQEITLTRTKTNRVRRVPVAEALLPALQEALAGSKSGYVFESRPRQALHPQRPPVGLGTRAGRRQARGLPPPRSPPQRGHHAPTARRRARRHPAAPRPFDDRHDDALRPRRRRRHARGGGTLPACGC